MFLFQVDLEGLRTVSSDRGRAMAAELGLPYFETSAATGQGDLLQISYSHSVLVFIKHETYLRIIHLSRCWRRCGSIAGPCHGKNREESCQSQVLINQITKLNLCERIEENVRPIFKGQFKINKFSEKSKPRAAVPQPKPGRGLFGSPTQGKWKYLGWMWKKENNQSNFHPHNKCHGSFISDVERDTPWTTCLKTPGAVLVEKRKCKWR